MNTRVCTTAIRLSVLLGVVLLFCGWGYPNQRELAVAGAVMLGAALIGSCVLSNPRQPAP